jgi:hypothetical protein
MIIPQSFGMGLLEQSWPACRWNLGRSRGVHCGRVSFGLCVRGLCDLVMLRTKTKCESYTLDSMPLARRVRGEKKRRAARGDEPCSWACVDAYHISQGLRTLEAVQYALPQRLSSRVNAAEHSRTAFERSQPTLPSVLLPLPRRDSGTRVKVRLANLVPRLITSRRKQQPRFKYKQMPFAAERLHGLSREDQHIQCCL